MRGSIPAGAPAATWGTRARAAALLALAFAAPSPLLAQGAPPAAEPSPQAAAARGPTGVVELGAFLDGLMAAHLEEHDVAGATVSVVRGGELVFARGYGWADRQHETPVDPERTLFRIGSVSKLFTWTAVMQLVEEGKLDLDADVNTYLDFEIPATYPEPITLFHLLTHTPGFEERAFGLMSGTDQPRGEWLAENIPARVRPPGTFSAYSNYGTSLAGYIVGRAAGTTWEEYVERRILEPLGMEHTSVREPLPEHLAPLMSQGYGGEGGRYGAEPKEFERIGPMSPAGSVSASAADMGRFMSAWLQLGRLGDTRILSEETAARMLERAFTHDDRLNGFGLGFYEKSAHGLRIVGHGGDTQWFHSDLALIPAEQLGIFVSYNSAGGGALSFGPFLRHFLRHYYPGTGLAADEAADSLDLARYAGGYRTNRASYTKFEKVFGLLSPMRIAPDEEKGELVVSGGIEPMHLTSLGGGLFRDAESSELVAFREDEGGRVTHVFLGAAPMMAFERVPWYGHPLLHGVLLGVALLVFAILLVGAVQGFFLDRRYAEVREARSGTRSLRRTAVVVAVLNLAFVIGFAVLMADASSFLLKGDAGVLRVLLALPVLAALGTAVLAWLTARAWRTGSVRRWGRVRYAAVTLASLGFVLSLWYWNLLGWFI